ncbi:pilus assembly protein TadG-related protein [Methylomicrobium sp. RS1]|uniref:pilus assembly protein TadG-related protein n=1 Tax=Candidatus Methylomicrobium oryzae TaxID=2802053 RepID=UPI001921A20D|nr:pilus assembly protein TadG-related protein [Methylomicrobium sp. RS1]MBL1263676.1 hypothetical protein [Methylomicrobium sp. RS1]
MEFKNMKKQCGTTMFLSLVFMLGMVAMIGLATTTGRLVTDKTTLQNALDAAALSAAITVNGDPAKKTATATQKGRDTFNTFKAATGNHELSGVQDTDLTFEYSKTLKPFDPKSTPPAFVRVSMNKPLEMPAILLQVLDTFKDPIDIAAISTAGAVGQNCTLTPFVLCANETTDTHCETDNNGDGIKECFGYNMGTKVSLLMPSCTGNSCTLENTNTSLESGNFNLINLDGLQGGKDIREALTNKTLNLCSAGNLVETKPGYTWGNVEKGIDGRYESDTEQANNLTYSQYASKGTGNNRRIMAVPIADCSGIQHGTDIVPKIGVACMFLLMNASDASKKANCPPGTTGSCKQVLAEFFNACEAAGAWSPTNAVLNGPYDIVIFKTEGSGDS